MMDSYIEQNKEKIVRSLQELIRIPSVKGEPSPGAPFGKEVKRALDYTLDLCRQLGFEAHDVDGYIGYAQIPSCADKEQVAVLTHLDVVPEGQNWSFPPFGGDIDNGKLYGRGTTDNKGPAIATIYALKALMESGQPLNKNIRLIFGCDEESGWGCIDHYQEKIGMPEVGFSPDADYPIINTEKGIYHSALQAKISKGAYTLSVAGGSRPNVVPDYARAHIEGDIDKLFNALMEYDCAGNNVEYKATSNTLDITAYGVSAHASTPEKGNNALWNLFKFLNALNLGGDAGKIVQWACSAFVGSHNGQGISGLALEDEVSGKLTINLGICNIGDYYDAKYENQAEFLIDIRFPVIYNSSQINDIITATLPDFITCVPGHMQEPHHLDENHYLIQALKKVYTQYMGLPGRCIAIGGGTYARALKYGVAFGITKENGESLAHNKDENIEIDYLILNTKIFAAAMAELAK